MDTLQTTGACVTCNGTDQIRGQEVFINAFVRSCAIGVNDMKWNMFRPWRRVARPRMGKARTQYNHELLLGYVRTAMVNSYSSCGDACTMAAWSFKLSRCHAQVAVAASGWEFVAEITHSSDLARAVLLLVPQLVLLVLLGLRFGSVRDLRIRKRTHVCMRPKVSCVKTCALTRELRRCSCYKSVLFQILALLILLVSVMVIAAVCSGFRMAISLCCCSRSFWYVLELLSPVC